MSKKDINLPKTSFSMKANLPNKEPEILKIWQKLNLYKKLREARKGKEKFVLHDGPPYANGHIHMGTALNKILKDIVTRFHQMDGKDSVYVPGWDCHGLPIEWKIEEQYKKNKKNKDEVSIKNFRLECREFAEKWIKIHTQEFKRLGVEGDWKNYYSTMSFEAEAQIVRELGKFLLDDTLYQGYKPVLWSTVEKTALADAEVEYKDYTSNTIYTSFEIKKNNRTSYLPLCEYLIRKYKIKVQNVIPDEKKPFAKKFDPIKKTFLLSDYLTLATKKLHTAAQIAHLEANDILDEYLDTFKFPSEES